MTPEKAFDRLLRDNRVRDRCAEVLKILFRFFLKDWVRWEILGWILASYLGFINEDLERNPELGWFAKVAVAYALMRSDEREHILLGRALLYHTELPPRELFVRYGGALIPAVVYHYRASWRYPKVQKEFKETIEKLQEELGD